MEKTIGIEQTPPTYGASAKNSTSVLNLMLRILCFVFSLMALAFIVSVISKYGTKVLVTSAGKKVEFKYGGLSALNAIAMVYSLIQAILGCKSSSILPKATCVADAVITVLLLLCSVVGIAGYESVIHAIPEGYQCPSDFCHRLIVAIAMTFVSFFFLLCSAIRSCCFLQ